MLVEKSMKIDAANYTALEVRGKIRTGTGNYAAAIKIVPGMAPAYLSRGLAKMLSGSEADAQKDFDKYLQIFPNGKPYFDQEVERARQTMQK